MKIETRSATDEVDYREYYEILVDGNSRMTFRDGEPEDNGLSRNFNDVYSIVDLVKQAHSLGKKGIDLKITHQEISWDDI